MFDVDGTLVDSVDLHARAWQDAFRSTGREIDLQRFHEQIGKGGDQLLPVFLSDEEIKAEGKVLEEQRGALFKENYLTQVKGFPGVPELFQRLLRDGKKIALASSAKGEDLEIYKRIAGIDGLLHAETSSDDAEKSKPHPDIFQAALDKLGGIDPRAVIAIGDTPYDAEAAGKAGIQTIGLLCGGWSEQALRQAGCIEVYRDPSDLLAQYDQSSLSR